MAELPLYDRAGAKDLPCPLGKFIYPGHDHLLDGGGDGDALDVPGDRYFPVPGLDNLQILQRLDELLDEEGNPLRFLKDQVFQVPVYALGRQDMLDHGEALTVGKPVQRHLAVVGAAAPGVDELRPVGEDQKDLDRRYSPEVA